MPDIKCEWFFYQPPFVCCIVTFGIWILNPLSLWPWLLTIPLDGKKATCTAKSKKTIDIAHWLFISVYIVIILYRQLGLSLLEWRFYYFPMFRNPVNQFMHLNPLQAVKTFTWTAAELHAWRSRYWQSRGQIVYRRNHRNGARLLQRTLKPFAISEWIVCSDKIFLAPDFRAIWVYSFFYSLCLNKFEFWFQFHTFSNNKFHSLNVILSRKRYQKCHRISWRRMSYQTYPQKNQRVGLLLIMIPAQLLCNGHIYIVTLCASVSHTLWAYERPNYQMYFHQIWYTCCEWWEDEAYYYQGQGYG